MPEPTYVISDDGRSITCKLCGLASYHREDVRQHYCGHCHLFHDDVPIYLRADVDKLVPALRQVVDQVRAKGLDK